MSGSSVPRANPFEGLRWRHVFAMLTLLRDGDIHDERHVQKVYKDHATGFLSTTAFLADIGMVSREYPRLICCRQVPANEPESIAVVLEQLLSYKSRYRTAVFRYLRHFRISAGEARRYADAGTRSTESPVRNFLMEIGVVRHRVGGDYHVVDPAYIHLYAMARRMSGGVSPARMASRSARQEEFGLEAETAVVALERQRLGPRLADRVEHVSRTNATAGYDIFSFTDTSDGTSPRYIEVKAVSGRSFQFYWTENEMDVATLLSSFYYLYLVPVGMGGDLLTHRVVMISDPIAAVLRTDDWIVEPNVRVCRPRIIAHVESAGCP